MNLMLVVGICLLLLIVGTLLGRYYTPDRRPLRRAAEEGRSYARGLVEVLEGHDDAAIEEITRTLRRNTKTVEAYFALGTLFRKRGEYERAVRVHQAILMRRDIDKQIRLRVHQQLALDFKQAGFVRRAVRALEFVVAKDKKRTDALAELAVLYEQDGRWERAAAIYRRLGKVSDRDTGALQAHMLAEHAHDALDRGELSVARKSLRRAVAASEGSVHALHVLALYQQRKDSPAAAARVWEKALRRAPELVSFFGPRLEATLFEQDRLDDYERLLEQLLQEHPGDIHLRLAYARFDARRDPRRALEQLTGLLEEAPNLLPARREAARLVLAQNEPEAIRAAFEELLQLLARADRGFRCASCGHTDDELFWRCPSCGSWDSVRVAWGRRAGEGAPRRLAS